MSKLITLIILTQILNIIKTETNTLKKNQSLKTSYYENPEQRINGLKIFTGIGQDNKSDKLKLEINIGYRKVLIGDSTKVNFGIRCDENYINTCSLKSDKNEIDKYYNKSYNFFKAEIYTRFLKEEELFVDGVPKLKIDLVSKVEDWPLGDFGVIGLHQHGDFVSYLKDVYKNQDIFFLLSFKSGNDFMEFRTKLDMEIVINPEFKEEDKRVLLEFDQERRNLEVPVSFSLVNSEEEEEFIFQDEDLCFSSIGENLFHLENADIVCNKLKNKICDDLNNCKKNNADYNKASVLNLKINDIDFTFNHEEYFYYDEDKNIECRFKEYNLNTVGVCSIVTTFAIGKGFIEKYPLVLGYENNGKNSILILNSKKNIEGSIWIWLLLGFIASVISFVVLVYVCFIKKKEEDDFELYIPLEK